ncbi:MAG: response regulator [Stellaceae bacterium]
MRQAGKSGPAILVIDDDPGTRDVLVGALEAAGYAVQAVATSMECLALLDGGGRFDLLIIDVLMPPPSPHGFALGRMARNRNPGQALIYISGLLGAIPEAELKGAQGPVLAKPVRIPEFIDSVRRVLETADQRSI